MSLDAVSLVRALTPEDDVQGMLVVGLDERRQVCGVGVNAHHRALSFVKVWELRALAAELEARSVVIAVFPTGGATAPTEHELAAFRDLCTRARRAQVLLHDCIVVRGARAWSLRELTVVDRDQQRATR